jgi:hypothetical protein
MVSFRIRFGCRRAMSFVNCRGYCLAPASGTGPASPRKENAMPFDISIGSTREKKAVLEPLVQLFPDATSVRIPVAVSISGRPVEGGTVNTMIEFGTSRVVIFLTELPLEIEDRLHLRNSDGTLDTDVIVIAVQYQDHICGVAARFAGEVRNWIIQVGP